MQTHEEEIVYVKELDMFLTMKVFENTPAVLSFGTFCDENGCDDSEIREWLQESRGKVVDDEIQLQGGSHASSSHEAFLEPTSKRRQDWGKHNVHDHFPKDRNCEICKRTKITRAPWRRRNGEAVPRVDNFGDLITADHKVLSDSCEYRNNHRYAVVVQDLDTQWIQANPCKNQNFTRNLQEKSSQALPKFPRSVNDFWFPLGFQRILQASLIARLHHTDRRQMVLPKE